MIKKENISLILLSLVLTILIIEIAMRLAGFAFIIGQDQRNKKRLWQEGSITILCIGESTTALWGEDAYPNQLHRILNNRFPDKKITVINKGVSAITTSQILKKLPFWIKDYDPDIVISMMGINDEHELLSFYSNEIERSVFSFILDLRVYKLYRWLKFNLSNSFKNAFSNNTAVRSNESVQSLDENADEMAFNKFFDKTFPYLDERAKSEYFLISQRNSREIPKESFLLYRKAQEYNDNKEYQRAEEILKPLLNEANLNGLENFIYKELLLSLAEQEKYKLLQIFLEDLFEKETSFVYFLSRLHELCEDDDLARNIIPILQKIKKGRKNTTHYLYDLMANCYDYLGESKQSNNYMKKADEIRNSFYASVVKENYLQLAEVLNEKKIQMVVMQYPLRSITPLELMLRKAPNANEIIFIENLNNFKKALKENNYEDIFLDRFAGNFGHSNSEGNRLIAENVASVLENYF